MERKQDSAASCYEQLKLQELQAWLETHKPEVAEKYRVRRSERKHHETLQRNFSSCRDPDEHLNRLLVFSSPVRDSAHKGALLSSSRLAVEQILHTQTNNSRYKAGLGLGTLLIEHKRQVILKALSDRAAVGDSQAEAQQKLDAYLADCETRRLESPGSISGIASPPPSTPLPGLAAFSSASPSRPEPSLLHLEQRGFRPQWEHYGAMRTRWEFIQPQVKSLRRAQEQLVPFSTARQLRLPEDPGRCDPVVLQGSVVDVRRFNAATARSSSRTEQINSSTEQLAAEKRRADSRIYTPQHAVRF